jgi:hypothetical protein
MSEPSNIRIQCPSCGQNYSVEPDSTETSFTCVKCNTGFSVPPLNTNVPRSPGAPGHRQASSGRFAGVAKVTSLLDGFIALLFRFGKSFSGFLAVIFLLGILLSSFIFITHLRSSIEVPTYEQMANASSNESGDSSAKGTTALDNKRDVEKRFGDDIAGLVKEHSLGDSAYEGILGYIANLEKEYRADYVSGLKKFLRQSAKAKKHSIADALEFYSQAFGVAEAQAIKAKTESSMTRWGSLASILVCCFMLFMMLVIPALLKIEENTRPKP